MNLMQIIVSVIFLIIGLSLGFLLFALCSINNINEPVLGSITEKALKNNNILLKISLWKMIIGFAPKDENGFYYTGVNGFVSDAFCRLGIENHTVDEQMALCEIEALGRELGELYYD